MRRPEPLERGKHRERRLEAPFLDVPAKGGAHVLQVLLDSRHCLAWVRSVEIRSLTFCKRPEVLCVTRGRLLELP